MTFKIFGTTVPADAEEFKDFWTLNNVMERDNISPDEVRQAYHDVLLWTLNDVQKTDIHWQIQYLFNEVRVPVNRVLHFLDAKFGSLEDAIFSAISESKLKSTNMWRDISIFTDMSVMWRIESRVINTGTNLEKAMIVLEFSQDETEEQRLEAFKVYLSWLEEVLEDGDKISSQWFLMLKKEQ